ncbi:MAG: twin transmembrane helix small protein [Comamonas sp.]
MKIVIVLAFLVILGSLASALLFMMRGNQGSNSRMAWALTVRIGVSVLVFLAILLAWKLGYIQPTGLRSGT